MLRGLLLKRSHPILNPSSRFPRAFYSKDSIFFTRQLVVVHKKLLQLFHELLAKILDPLNVRIAVIVR